MTLCQSFFYTVSKRVLWDTLRTPQGDKQARPFLDTLPENVIEQQLFQVEDTMANISLPNSYTEGYSSNVRILSQQKTPRLWGRSRMESQDNLAEYYDRVAEVDANEELSRGQDTPNYDVTHDRRQITLAPAEWGTLIDRLDKAKTIIDFQSTYVKLAVATLNRKKDSRFITAALGNAVSGSYVNGGSVTNVALPSGQRLAACDGSALTNMNVYSLGLVTKVFDDNDVDEDEKKYMVITGSQKMAMLRETTVTSQDYNTIKTLTSGKVGTFYGFTFVMTNLVPVTTATITTCDVSTGLITGGAVTLAIGARQCFAWVEDGMISAAQQDLYIDVGPRRDKKGNIGIYLYHMVGAVRIEDEMVVELLCTES